MRVWGGLLFAAMLAGQEYGPVGIVQGTFLEAQGSGRTGQFSLRTSNNSVFRFAYDEKTYVERFRRRIAIGALRSGDPLEVVSDQGDRTPLLAYARIVRVAAAPRAVRTPLFGTYRPPTEDIIPRGSITFAGAVLRADSGTVLLRTRTREVKRLMLRPDTEFVHNGIAVKAAALGVNTIVFVRAGQTLEGDLEAFQILWGEILKTGP